MNLNLFLTFFFTDFLTPLCYYKVVKNKAALY